MAPPAENLTDRSTLETRPGRTYNPPIDVLVLCTANQCRSPMAEVLLRRHLERAGVDATVSSAGLYEGGVPATDHGVAAMADRGLDLERPPEPPARRRHAAAGRPRDRHGAGARARGGGARCPRRCRKTFTLKELARGAAAAGERGADEPFGAWLGRIAGARVPGALVGVGHDDALDVADPVGRGRADYEVTADLLDACSARSSTSPSPSAAVPKGSTREGGHRSRPRRRAPQGAPREGARAPRPRADRPRHPQHRVGRLPADLRRRRSCGRRRRGRPRHRARAAPARASRSPPTRSTACGPPSATISTRPA